MAGGHPDKTPQAATVSATLLNEARRTLQNPALRIRHYLDLVFPGHQPSDKPPQDWDFLLRAGQATREGAELAAKKAAASHPLARAALESSVRSQRETLGRLKEDIESRLASAENRLRALPENSPDPTELRALAEEFAFLRKTLSSVRETLLSLDQGLA